MATAGRLTEHEGRARAGRHLRRLIGSAPNDLCWDQHHLLQGHVHVGERELVVIAPRDAVHEPIVLTAEDWDEACHAAGHHGAAIIRERAIRALEQLD
ncbi:MAG: hypothetical protein JWL72_4231 [Ilumatobacteraceae bacterium]|nr:hypothetical protein [Ilumatobacteraceae bacterium]MCU1390893.1 hypothetical protein [Ilumatobacteraceae bacterium]